MTEIQNSKQYDLEESRLFWVDKYYVLQNKYRTKITVDANSLAVLNIGKFEF